MIEYMIMLFVKNLKIIVIYDYAVTIQHNYTIVKIPGNCTIQSHYC